MVMIYKFNTEDLDIWMTAELKLNTTKGVYKYLTNVTKSEAKK